MNNMFIKFRTVLLLSVVSVVFLSFNVPSTANAQTPPSGTLHITTTSSDDVVSGQAGPNYVFWYLISGYPSPSNPWVPVNVINGTGEGTTQLAEGYYGVFQQYEYEDWRFVDITCDSGTPLEGLGQINVQIISGLTTNCTFGNKYIAKGNLNMVVQTDGGSTNFIFTLQHTGMADQTLTVATEGLNGEHSVELHADVPSSPGSSNFLNSYTVMIGDGTNRLPAGWILDDLTCQMQSGSETGTYSSSSFSIYPVPVEPHKTTTCTLKVHQKVGVIEIYTNLSSSSTEINDIKNSAPDKRPAFIYQMGGFLGIGTGSLTIGAGGNFYYPLPYYIQVGVDNFPETDTDVAARSNADTKVPWAWGKDSISVNPGIYYIQQNTTDSWQPSSVTCVQIYEDNQDLTASASTPPATPTAGDRIFIDEKNNWVDKCGASLTTNCCSVLITSFYKDDNHLPPTPPAQPAAPPLLDYGNPEKCIFGTTSPVNKQFNIPLNSNAVASVPVSPGGKTVCVFNNTKTSGGSGGRSGSGEFQEPPPGPNIEPGS